MTTRYLLYFLLSLIYTENFAQVKCKIYCPVEADLLAKNKIQQIEVNKETIGTATKELITTYIIDKSGCPIKETYLPQNVPGSNWMKRELKTSADGKEIVYTFSMLNNIDKSEKLFEKITEVFDGEKRLTKKISEKHDGTIEIKTEIFDPTNNLYKDETIIKRTTKDTIHIITHKKNATDEVRIFRSKLGGMWVENERAITNYKDNVAIAYKLYKNGVLMNSWNKSNEPPKKIIETDQMNNPLPTDDRPAKRDTLFSADGKAEGAIKTKSKKSYMVIHEYGDHAYRDKILTTYVYLPNGLLYSKHNTAESIRLIYTYK